MFNGTQGERKSLQVHSGRQGKHIVGHNNYSLGKSVFSGTIEDAQRLIHEFSGKGTKLPNGRERVDFKKPIGYYVDQNTSVKTITTIGIIHYSKDGAHIVPSKPNKE
ncbi:MAG: polymorphic toxin type 50 domain-containing protein [Firmicutes bacterium]|nr:polymorphic toxin type 50 domain-containing protein [Bacillota bacterium]